jgi:hypothetical protein
MRYFGLKMFLVKMDDVLSVRDAGLDKITFTVANSELSQ